MANKNSERVQHHRKENFDRLPILVEKGNRDVIHLMAKREGLSMAEYIRRAILARAGLRAWPYPATLDDMCDGIADALADDSRQPADKIIKDLQQAERKTEYAQLTAAVIYGEPMDGTFRADLAPRDMADLKSVISLLSNRVKSPSDSEESITLSGYEIGVLRRLLANITLVDEGNFVREQQEREKDLIF